MSNPTEASPQTDRGLVIEHSTVDALVDRLVDAAESLSAGFDQWEEQYVSGPSLYGVVFADPNYERYVDPLGANIWPTDVARVVTAARTNASWSADPNYERYVDPLGANVWPTDVARRGSTYRS